MIEGEFRLSDVPEEIEEVAFWLIQTVASIIFFTVFDFPVLVIPNKDVRFPRKSNGLI